MRDPPSAVVERREGPSIAWTGIPSSFAAAFMRYDFPHPGGPKRRTPFEAFSRKSAIVPPFVKTRSMYVRRDAFSSSRPRTSAQPTSSASRSRRCIFRS